ncbi:FYVE, RhoGEF and PH domain containing 5/6 [Mytilus galloprovincialis]|uniref:FYVE, RhoGEF and PH domain containing 5/6 n=1 Tax=Mytilus galloprovincialis TaxID=29158 RepID=A0A8B6CPC0_MYTGA|nr:FYVE, RhoGEF and PH domain containing 5/6 [Mytilus galloprovincialis]
MESRENCKKVADIFVKKGPFLKMYTAYITDFEETNRVFDDAIKKIPTFQQVVKEFEMSPRCASLGVRHYLLKPIQRIPQYKLLLQDYLKHLSPESEDYENTKIALHIVSEVADHANSSMRQGDQVQKMLEIQKSLEGQFEVIKPGRDLIKKGELMKLSRKEMQPRMFFLFNDVLLYTTPTPTGGYRLNNVLTLSGMKITLPASKEYNTEFNIVTVQRSFTVEASSEKDRDEWVTSLKNTIDDYTQRKNTFETVRAGNQSFYDKDFVLGSKAPIWIPDARVTMCMLCTCEFSVAWRRHHCRSCGRVICSTCSDNRAPLEYLRNKPARVCNECFHTLKTDFNDKVETGNVTEGMREDIDGSVLSLSSIKERFQQIRRSARFSTKVKRPKRLIEVHANNLDCSMSGYLKVLKGKKWKKFWFLLKDKVLYKFKASEDVAAKESMAVIGYEVIKVSENFEGVAANLVFQLSHKNQSPFVFQTDNASSTDRWIKAMEEAVQG